MHIAISGVSGFIGSQVARAALARGWGCVGLVHDHDPSSSLRGHLTYVRLTGTTEARVQQLNEFKLDAIVHCATRYSFHHTLAEIDDMVAGNIQSGLPLLEYATANDAEFVNLSSVFQHGPGLRYSPNSLYAATKQAFADLVVHYSLNGGLSAVDLCLHDTYGPGDRRKKLIPGLVRAILENRSITLGSLDTQLNLVHISDVVSAIFQSIEERLTGSFSCVADEEVTVRHVIELLEDASGRRLNTVIDPSTMRNSAVPKPFAPRLPNWKPLTELRHGLAELLVSELH